MLERMVRPQRGSKNRLETALWLKTNCLNSSMRKQCSWRIFSCGYCCFELSLQRWKPICQYFKFWSCYSIKTLKCREICMCLMPPGSKIYYEIKKTWVIICQFAWTSAIEPAIMEGQKSQKTFLLIITDIKMFVWQLLSQLRRI